MRKIKNKIKRNKPTAIELKRQLRATLARLEVYQKKLKLYQKKYWMQIVISASLLIVLVVVAVNHPVILAAPTQDSVTITSDAEWNQGTTDDITVGSGSIEISGDGGAGWINEAGWSFRQKLTFDASSLSGSVSNIPIMAHITNSNTNFWNNTPSRDEVRIGDSDGTLLDFHFEKFDHTSDDAIIWIEVPNLQNNNTDHVYMYYSKSGASNGEDETGTYDTDGGYAVVQHLEETPSNGIEGHFDSTNNNIDGTPYNFNGTGTSNTDAAGTIDGADIFDGSNDYINIGSSNDITGNNLQTITFEAWVKSTSSTNTYIAAIKRSSSHSTLFSLTINRNTNGSTDVGCLGVIARNNANTTHSHLGYDGGYNDGEWHHIAAVIDGLTRTLYIDGVSRDTDNDGMQSVSGNTAYASIGAFDASQLRFPGSIDEVRISRAARSADWIKATYLSESEGLITWGSQEAALQSPGTYTSQNLDVNQIYRWGDCTGGSCTGSSAAFTANVTVPANTAALFELRHSANGSSDWSTWTTIHNQTSVLTGTITKTRTDLVSSIGDISNRYVQIRVTLSSTDGTSNPSIADYKLDYTTDVDAPINPTSQNGYSDSGMGTGITTATWYGHAAPHFTWSGATDADSGMTGGYSGYWVCFGAVDCEPTSGAFVTSAAYTASSLTTNQTYYLRIKSRDAAGNVASSAYAAFEYRYDVTDPANPSGILPNPAGFSNNDSFSFNWNAGTDTGGSGIDEYCYKTGADGAVDTCIPGTSVSGITSYQEGTNKFYVRTKDVAGNTPSFYTSVNYYYSANAPSEPQNLQVAPSANTTNSFTFSWLEPASYSNPIKGYHYSINAMPNANNTTYTTSTSIGPGAYATQQGINVFYVIAEDTASNKNWSSYSSVEFTATTSAPGIPTGVTVTDSSIRAQQKYSLTITWNEPDDIGSGIDHYSIERSTDTNCATDSGAVFTECATATGLGYLDTGLVNTTTYCYRIKSADNASATSAVSSIVSALPEGRYTEAPDLVGNPGVEARIQSAVVEWLTDREGSSFVEFGTSEDLGRILGQDDFVSSHSVTLLDLEPDTTYYYKVKYTDQDSNTGYSSVATFVTADALSPPTNLDVTPDSNTTNSFTFSWNEPIDEGVTIRGYYYSINSTPTSANTSFTAQTELGPGPYATQQGTNTFYVVAIDDSNNINYANYASVNFEATTAAPAIPTGLIITDSSNREQKVYSITLVWRAVSAAATTTGDDDVVYVIERSIDSNDDFTAIAETTSYGYLDVGLDNAKKYYYRVKAKDSAGAISAVSTTVSDIPEGRYTTPPEITSGPTVTPDSFSATIIWDTERETTSFVQYGLTEDLGEEQGESDLIDEHSNQILGLNPETIYHYRVKSVDIDGNVALSTIATFTTLEAPRVSDVDVSDVKLYDALITWTTNKETTSRIEYGIDTNYGSVVYDTSGSLTKSHTLKLNGLIDGTTYHFRPTGEDANGNSPESGDYVFTTLTFPQVLSVAYENRSEGQTEVTWTTNVTTTSIVEYYNDNIAPKTQGNEALVANHSILLYGLEDAATYQFVVRGVDQFGYSATSQEQSFTTLEDTTPPEIYGVQSESNTIGSGEASKVQIVISWKTDEATTSQIEYGVGLSSDDYTDQTDENAELVMDHLVVIPELAPAKTYHFRTVSADKAGNETKSGSYSVLTTRERQSFLQLLVGNFEDTFYWLGSIGDLF